MNKKRKEVIAGNKVSELLTMNLGGYNQKVLIEGKNEKLPIVITLHGGPGTPIPFSVGCRGMFPEFTNKFIMVYWDQLGCGINNYKIDESFKVKNFVDMTNDLLDNLRNMFPDNKILIFGTSWGSVLSALISEIRYSDISGVVVCGQIVRDIFFNDEVIGALEKSDVPKKRLEIIKNAKRDTATAKELQTFNSCLMKYTDAYNNKNGDKAPIGKMIKELLASPDYSLMDFKAIMYNGYVGNRSLWAELLEIDLTKVIESVRIPYLILQGDTDIVASTAIIKSIVGKADNKNLKCTIVKNTGHFPGIEMMDAVFKALSNL